MNNYDDLLLEESGRGRGYEEPEPLTEEAITDTEWQPVNPLLPELVMGFAEDVAQHPVSTIADFIAPVAMLPIALPMRMVESGIREGMKADGDFNAFKQGAKQELDDAAEAIGAISDIVSIPASWLTHRLESPISWLKSKMIKQPKPTIEQTYTPEPLVFKEDYKW